MSDEIAELEMQLYELTNKLNSLKRKTEGTEVPNYTFDTLQGATSLLDCFGDKEKLLVIHNMGQGCRYCTLWGDEINGVLAHLESAMSVLLVSKDSPELQRKFANARGWRFRLASHGGGQYIDEQGLQGGGNMPGAVVYDKQGDKILRKNTAVFGPGDLYCSAWNLLGLGGFTEEEWTPQFNYWVKPEKLDDGGDNVLG